MYMAVAPCDGCSGRTLGAPCRGCSGRTAPLSLGSWLDDIKNTVGDVGERALDEIKSRLLAQYGQQAWDALPQDAKQSAISAAWADVQSRVNWLPWVVAGALAYLLLRR